jgi:hypothetical protein
MTTLARIRHGILLSLFLLLPGVEALAYEEPKYEVEKQYPDFELRRYAPYLTAETEVTGAFSEVGNVAFRILADYIGGNNRPGEVIPMTAPVHQVPGETAGEKISMAVPVTQTPLSSGTYVFSFVIPSRYTLDTVPQPSDARVRIRQVPATLMAARQYSGSWSEENYRRHEAILRQALQQTTLTIMGEPVFARYNAPFVPWFLRRNEVLVPVADKTGN